MQVLIGSYLQSKREEHKLKEVKQVLEQEGFPGYLIPVLLKHILYLQHASPIGRKALLPFPIMFSACSQTLLHGHIV